MYKRLSVLAVGLCLSSVAFSHNGEDEPRVALEPESSVAQTAPDSIYRFQIVDTKANKLIDDSGLTVTHEKKLHLIIYDPSLREFQHLHPEVSNSTWQVPVHFSRSGRYWVWAQGTLSDGVEFSSSTRLEVQLAGLPAWPPPALKELRKGTDSGSVATLSNQVLRAGKTAMLTLKLTKRDGSPAVVTPYLGAFAHVIATPEDGDSLLHVHPMNGTSPNEGMLHATFPEAGVYRVWVQFIDSGVLKTIPLAVAVTK